MRKRDKQVTIVKAEAAAQELFIKATKKAEAEQQVAQATARKQFTAPRALPTIEGEFESVGEMDNRYRVLDTAAAEYQRPSRCGIEPPAVVNMPRRLRFAACLRELALRGAFAQ